MRQPADGRAGQRFGNHVKIFMSTRPARALRAARKPFRPVQVPVFTRTAHKIQYVKDLAKTSRSSFQTPTPEDGTRHTRRRRGYVNPPLISSRFRPP